MNFNKDEIERLYFEEKLSTRQISARIGTSQSTVMRILKDTPLRSKSDAAGIKYAPLGFSGNLDDLAYLSGIYLGDGCLARNSRTELLDITCDAKYPALIQRFTEVVGRVFGKPPSLHKDIFSRCVHIRLYGAGISAVLGFDTGPKKLKGIRIPPWILADKKYSQLCLRGLFETDGYIHYRRERVKSVVVGFSNTNQILLDEVHQLLYNLGYQAFRRNKTSVDCWQYEEAMRFIGEVRVDKS